MDEELIKSEVSPTNLQAVDDEERARRQEVKKARSVGGMEEKWRQNDRMELEEAVAANAPPLISEPRCSVCQSENRLWCERQLIMGRSNAAIAKSIPGVNSDTFRRALKTHFQKHMNLEQAHIRAVMQEEADLLNQNYDEGVKGAFTNQGALRILIQKAYSDAVDGITTVEPKDMIKMIELQEKIDSSSASRMVEEARLAVSIFMDGIRNVFADKLDRETSDELLQAIVFEVKRLREQNELESQIENNLRTIPRSTDSN